MLTKKNRIKVAIYTLPYFSSLLLFLAFFVSSLGWLSLCALTPLIAFFYLSSEQGISCKKIRLHAWLSGLLFFLLVFFWMTHTDPVTWSPAEGTDGDVIKYMIYAITAVFYSLSYYLLAVIVTRYELFKRNPLTQVLVFSAAFVLLEFLRSYLFSVLMYDQQATIGAHWNFGNLSFATSVTPLVFSSRLVGFYGLSFAALAVNFSLFFLLQRKFIIALVTTISVLIVSLAGFAIYQEPNTSKVNVAAVQVNDVFDINFAKKLDEFKSDHLKDLDVIALPEYSFFFDGQNNKETIEASSKLFNEKALFVTSSSVFNNETHISTNNLRFYSPNGQVVQEHIKNFLIPGGEYLPVWPEALMKAAGHTSLVDYFNQNKALQKGSETEQPYQQDNVLVGALVCSGVISPQLYQQVSSRGNPGIITNSASLNIFADAVNYHEQTRQMAKFHAVANNKPYVQSTRDGQSLIIDSSGNVLAESSGDNEIELISASVQAGQKQTVYTKFGSVFLLISSTVLVTWLVVNHPKKTSKKYK